MARQIIQTEVGGLRPLDPIFAQAWMDDIATRLGPHVVAVPKAWRKAVSPRYMFPRDCFYRAMAFVRASPHLPDALYIYGRTAGGGFNQHAWVEIDNCVVFDGVMQEFYDKQGYYSAEKACPWYRFTRPAVMFLYRKMRKDPTLTFRWDTVLGLPWASDPLNPLLVDLDRVKAGRPQGWPYSGSGEQIRPEK